MLNKIKDIFTFDKELVYPPFLKDLININIYNIASWSSIYLHEPISLLHSKPSGHGGSEILKTFNNTVFNVPLMYWKQELTVIDIYSDLYMTQFKVNNKRILFLEDTNRLLGKKNSTVKPIFTAFLLITQSNGLTDIVAQGGLKMHLEPPLMMSLVSVITKDVLDLNFIEWSNIGLIDRLLIPTWKYTDNQQEEICDFLDNKLNYKDTIINKSKKLDFGKNNKLIINNAKELFRPLREEAKIITNAYYGKFEQLSFKSFLVATKNVSKDEKLSDIIKSSKNNNFSGSSKPSFLRKYEKLRLLTLGKVISEGRKEVLSQDVEYICNLSKQYFRLEYNPINNGKME
jgi:hypothetical protein